MTVAFVFSSIRETDYVTLHEANITFDFMLDCAEYFGDMISPCFVKQGWRQFFTLGYSPKKYLVFEVLKKQLYILHF